MPSLSFQKNTTHLGAYLIRYPLHRSRELSVNRRCNPLIAMLFIAPEMVLGQGNDTPDNHRPISSIYEQLISKASEAVKYPAGESTSRISLESPKITPTVWANIRFRSQPMPWGSSPLNSPIQLDYPAPFLPFRTRFFWADHAIATEVPFSNLLFAWPNKSIKKAPETIKGFSGIRLLTPISTLDKSEQSWMMFLGDKSIRGRSLDATYGSFARLLGSSQKAQADATEIAGLSEIYIERVNTDGDPEIINGWVDNEAMVGAVRFSISKNTIEVTQEVEATLFIRQDIGSMDFSPLGSSFSFNESDRKIRADIHPELHDADGALIQDGEQRRIFRPLRSPSEPIASIIPVHNLKGFGLLQRDREPEHYLDLSRPETRASVWVEPISPFGPGEIRLNEVPYEEISSENIQMVWRSQRSFRIGETVHLHYRIHWTQGEPKTELARCIATHIGRLTRQGQDKSPIPYRFRIEFDRVQNLPKNLEDMNVITNASRGKFLFQRLIQNAASDRFFIEADYLPDEKPIADVELTLKRHDTAISETWRYRISE
jgi:periplasmic glucans biosynthesis protein